MLIATPNTNDDHVPVGKLVYCHVYLCVAISIIIGSLQCLLKLAVVVKSCNVHNGQVCT
jgi:hypothetical protein